MGGSVGRGGWAFVLCALLVGCSSERQDAKVLPRDEMLDPATCGRCHEDHFREWSGSMHAYAAEDPVFVAFNKRLQRETNGQLGDLCVRCHAPMAVRDGLTKDGLNLAALPAKYRGVTCFFCHTIESVGALHNNGLEHGDESVMRGAFADAVANDAHRSKASSLHDARRIDSASMCGSCHDIVTPGGAHIERTFAEWKESVFATTTGATCGTCHMKPVPGVQPIANVPGVFAREAHAHTFAGVDRALTPFPNAAQQTAEIQAFLDSTVQASLCISTRASSAQIRVILDNVGAGHSFPSGAGADRRLWVELVATKQDRIVYQTGMVEDRKPIMESAADPDLWLLRDRVFDVTGHETHQFGLATCYETRLLPFAVTKDVRDPRYYQRNVARDFPSDPARLIPLPDTVSMRLRLMPVGLEVLDDLVATGDLDPAVRDRMEPMQIGPTLTWTPGAGEPMEDRATRTVYACVTRTNQTFGANAAPPKTTSTCGP